MRNVLALAYKSGLVAGVFFLAFIAFVILLQIGGRLVGIVIPSAGELAGYSMAASIFLALADTLRSHAHIRVELLIGRLPRPLRKAFNVWAYGFSASLIGYLTFHSFAMTWNSFSIGAASPGLLAIPLWIPQSGMSIGLALFAIACTESAFDLIVGRESPDESSEPIQLLPSE